MWKCSEEHKTEDCQKPKKPNAKCANCGETNTADWKGFSAYKETVKRTHPKKGFCVIMHSIKTIENRLANSSDNNTIPETSKQQQR